MRIAEAQLVRAIDELAEAKSLTVSQLAQAVRQFLTRKRLMKRSGKMMQALAAYEEKRSGNVMVTATSAHALAAGTKTVIEDRASALFTKEGQKTTLLFREDPRILGGIRLETSTLRYDFSLAGALTQLRKSFSK